VASSGANLHPDAKVLVSVYKPQRPYLSYSSPFVAIPRQNLVSPLYKPFVVTQTSDFCCGGYVNLKSPPKMGDGVRRFARTLGTYFSAFEFFP
jgi:hypothetical protein